MSFKSRADQLQISLEFDAAEEEIQAYLDLEKVETILSNLLSNAFKFTDPQGKVRVRVARILDYGVTGPGTLRIQVTDDGIGMSPDVTAHVFEKFYQASGSHGARNLGSGIGLSLTRELVELHHGSIDVESLAGEGTIFTVNIPLDPRLFSPGEIQEESNRTPRTTSGIEVMMEDRVPVQLNSPVQTDDERPVVLLVEDNHEVRDYVRSYLDFRYNVVEAASGEEGLDHAIAFTPDLVVSDVMMGEMDGMEMCRLIKSDERTCHIPVVLLTAKATEDSKLTGLSGGADDYLTKPFSSRELLIRISNLLENRKRMRDRFGRMIKESADPYAPIEVAPPEMSEGDRKFIARVTNIIAENMEEPNFDLPSLIEHLGMSESQLRRKLRALTGETPVAFLRTQRLKRAAELILENEGTISEIAFRVGFNHLSYFSKCFMDQFGKLPSEFRSS
jgi:DNA-binding response OmpR family regulator/anti-sigma regulatory factor (Ser/Thr protein kinase)